MSEKENVFTVLSAVNVNEHVEKKNTGKAQLSYLSWAWAWAEVKKRYPDATYEIVKFDNGLPYCFDPNTGYMCYTKVTIDGITHEMWLPVMDSHNEAMLDHPRTVKTKFSEFTVDACTMFDVNKTVMRCLTKNLAMFGLGHYIYAGEDLPEEEFDQERFNLLESAALDYINTGVITGDGVKNVEEYIKTKNIGKLQQTVDWCKKHSKIGA